MYRNTSPFSDKVPQPGDKLWWQNKWAMWTPQDEHVKEFKFDRFGYSFDLDYDNQGRIEKEAKAYKARLEESDKTKEDSHKKPAENFFINEITLPFIGKMKDNYKSAKNLAKNYGLETSVHPFTSLLIDDEDSIFKCTWVFKAPKGQIINRSLLGQNGSKVETLTNSKG